MVLSILMAALLGLIQGLAEFLPISSSGHLNLLQALFGVDLSNQLLFNILLHVGTLIAVLVVFWHDWVQMILHPIKNKTLLLLFIASLPALAAKLIFDDQLPAIEPSTKLLGACLLLTGLLLMLTQAISKHNQRRAAETDEVRIPQALAMGCMQAVGLLPGVSRSGSTIFGGVASKLTREKAAKFSFMMSMPAIVGSLLSEGYSAYKAGALTQMSTSELLPIAVGMLVAGISGYLAVRFMLKIIAKVSLNWFALYVILLSIVVIILQATGVLVDAPAAADAAARLIAPLA